MPAFEEASGLSVTYKEDFNDNEEWFAKVKDSLDAGQDIGTDLVMPSEFMVARLIRLGWLEELDDANIPNKVNLRTDLLDSTIDDERRYSAALHVRDGRPGLQPRRHRAGHHQRRGPVGPRVQRPGVAVLGHPGRPRHGHAVAGRRPGRPVGRGRAAADKVAEEKDKGQIRRFTGNDYADDLAAGNVAIAQAYSGDIVQLQADNPDLQFVVPEAGGTTFVD